MFCGEMGPEQERANDRLWEVAALITVLGAAIYGLGLLGVAWPIYKRWHNDAATTLYAISLIPRAVVAGQGVRIFMGFPTLIAITTGLAVPTFFVAGRLAAGAMNFHASFPYVTIDTSLLIVAIALSFLASSLLQLVDATAIEPPLPTVEITLSDGTQTVLEGKLLIHIEEVVYFFDEKRRLTSMPDGVVSSVRIRKEES